MKNAIRYYYNLIPEDIHQINKKYKFKVNNNDYILEPYTHSMQELDDIYELQLELSCIGFFNNQIVLNNNKEIFTNINGIFYVMLKVNVVNRRIDVSDILMFNNLNVDFNKFSNILRNNWYNLWIDKVDYLEYQISQFGKKYQLIRESGAYFIGIVENCISLLANVNDGRGQITVSHSRTTISTMLVDYLNPINFVLDIRVRDMAEYIKDCILKRFDIVNILDVIKKYIYFNRLNVYEINLLFIRILYPSYYFDMCEDIIDRKSEEDELMSILDNIYYIENYIKKIYIELRCVSNIPEIEWLLIDKKK